MHLKKLLLSCLVMLSIPAMAQKLTISGTVVDAYAGHPVKDINIGTDTTNSLTSTAEDGSFRITVAAGEEIWCWGANYFPRKARKDTSKQITVALLPRHVGLKEVKIQAFSKDKTPFQSAGSIAHLNEEDLTRYHNFSVKPALNTIPGVRMESRGIGGSNRISIRGSKLRAPFGVRNIKVYWNGMPLTSPDGSTPSEILDAQAISNAEVIKGPSGSMYGSGTGGVMQFKSKQTKPGHQFVQANSMAGSYGLQRYAVTAGYGTEKAQINAFYSHGNNEGYREHESNYSNFFRFNAHATIDKHQSLRLFGYHYEGKWDLPGSLSREDYRNNPQSAVPFSIAGNASVWRERTTLSAAHDMTINNWSHTLTVYASTTDKENPYGTSPFYNGIKYENAQGAGYRQVLRWHTSFDQISTSISAGTEGQTELNSLREFTNEEGMPGDLFQNSDTRSATFLAFVQNEWEFGHGISATAGVSYNEQHYDHQDFYQTDSIDFSNRMRFRPGWMPRFTVMKSFDNLSLYTTISEGFSSPTLWELLLPDGRTNETLSAEHGTNLEAGIKGTVWNDQLQFELTGYHFRLRNAILPVDQAEGNTIFGNAGATRQQGIEAVANWYVIPGKAGKNLSLKITQTYTFQHYVFDDYIEEGENYNNNRVPGVPYHEWNQMITLRLASGFYTHLTGRYIGKTPLTSGNTAFMHDYFLLDAKTGYQFRWKGFEISPYVGVQNALNTQYSSFLQVNHIAERYFNPSPGVTWFGGMSVRYQF